ncbi:putative DNA glycosylase At3g47830 isoform X1 [Magnolia sinica]|uniref:putative DNA glycosylase At3g47830 isoform X1 n=1 Tax=Magnolia sinica TaxID=86752 RepID=UPI002657E910|nr:putative DNA glycosylase At3g47830 isoform X1 [Magnolia sinica]
MATKCKRKVEIPGASSKLGKPKTTAAAAAELYPNHPRPTPEECRSVRDHLLSLHGFPQEFARYRKNKVIHDSPDPSKPFFGEDGSDETITRKEGVLDGLVRTLLSQNTTDSNSTKAFASLKSSFPTWEDVLAAETKCIQDAIKCGGLAATKASCIKNILSSLLEKRGKICLEYLRGMPVDEIKAELCCFKGIGPKTVACVLMFYLQQDDFPVDTHVFRIGKAIGWVPQGADREKAYHHLNKRIPNELKFDLNCLLITHGKLCQRCTKKGSNNQRRTPHHTCPLFNYG